MRVGIKVIGPAVADQAQKASEPVAQESGELMTVELPEGSTVKELIDKAKTLGIPIDQIALFIVNGQNANESTPLHDGDAVTMIGQASGM